MAKDWINTPSGLAVPSSPPPKPPPIRRPLELRDPQKREQAKAALSQLWDAMGLSSGGHRLLEEHPTVTEHEAYYQAYRFVGEMLLGDECPEKEMLT